jgi:hypothetical protein
MMMSLILAVALRSLAPIISQCKGIMSMILILGRLFRPRIRRRKKENLISTLRGELSRSRNSNKTTAVVVAVAPTSWTFLVEWT